MYTQKRKKGQIAYSESFLMAIWKTLAQSGPDLKKQTNKPTTKYKLVTHCRKVNKAITFLLSPAPHSYRASAVEFNDSIHCNSSSQLLLTNCM